MNNQSSSSVSGPVGSLVAGAPLLCRAVRLACVVLSTACSGEGENAEATTQPSICGSTTDWQNVESYDGTLGPPIAFVNAHQGPVGYMGPVGCSGTLIGPDLFLTAGHCVPLNDVVEFNYQLDSSGNPRATDSYSVSSIIEDDLGGVDYAIVRLDGDAGAAWGTVVPSALAVSAGEPITIIQHPQRLPKKIEGGSLQLVSNGRLGYDDLDTFGGTSGSGILQDRTGFLLGVHTDGVPNGQCGPGDPNFGESIAKNIYGQSAIIRQLAMDPAKLAAAVL
jgi:hypothetical protein